MSIGRLAAYTRKFATLIKTDIPVTEIFSILAEGEEGWLPDQLRDDALAEIRKPGRKEISDVEVVAYLSTASMAAPLQTDYAEIYVFLASKYLKKKSGHKPPINAPKSLTSDQQRKLDQLRHHIFHDQEKVVKDRERQARKLDKEN